MVTCFSPLSGEGQFASSFLSLHNALVFSAAISTSPDATHGLRRDILLYESQHEALQSNERIMVRLPCSYRHSRARGRICMGPKKSTGYLMDVGGV